MANLTVENLSGLIQSGDIESMMNGGNRISAPVAPEARVVEQMAKEGMRAPDPATSAPGTSFGQLLEKSINQVNQDQAQADRAVKEMVAGRNKNIHETMLTLERADTSLKMMMQVRNKVLEAYKEIMKMQV